LLATSSQRGSGVEAGNKNDTAKKAAPKERVRSDASRRKLSFNDKHALEKLPGEIES